VAISHALLLATARCGSFIGSNHEAHKTHKESTYQISANRTIHDWVIANHFPFGRVRHLGFDVSGFSPFRSLCGPLCTSLPNWSTIRHCIARLSY